MLKTASILPPVRPLRRVSLRAKGVFLGFNALLGMGIIEVAARLLVPPPLEWREHPARLLQFDPERGWALRPDADDFTVDKPCHVNSDGFRDRDFSVEKPAGTRRVVCLGDSYTYGWGVDVRDSYPKQLERALSVDDHPAEVLNLGVFGYNADQCRVTLRRQGLKYSPDLVIYSFYWDDLLPIRPELLNPDTFAAHEGEEGVTWWLRHTLRRSRAVFFAVQRARALRAALAPPTTRFYHCYHSLLEGNDLAIRDLWNVEADEIARMRDDAASVDARLVVIVWPLEAQVLSSMPGCHFEREAKRICDEAGVVSIPLLDTLQALAHEGTSPYLPYEQHPTPEAYHRVVGEIVKQLSTHDLLK